MHWEPLGFRNDPFKKEPISEYTLELYTGNNEEIDKAFFALNTDNAVMVIDGERGVGTTSFANYVRFSKSKEKKYFTPISEIKVEPSWNADTLMAAVVGNIVKSLEINYPDIVKFEPTFLEAKSVVNQITEKYKSFGFSGFGFGGNYGDSASRTQPMLMPTPMIADHLEALSKLCVEKLNYQYGVLIQLNNLDVGTVQKEESLIELLNIMRDYFQMPRTNWMLVGDQHLRRFIAQKIDRLDDIISTEISIVPLSMHDYFNLIDKRVKCFRVSDRIEMPVDKDVWKYLFQVTKGRLRYIFGLMNRLYDALKLGVLTDHISLDMAQPVIRELSEDRIKRNSLSKTELILLQFIANHDEVDSALIVDALSKSRSQISQLLSVLLKYNLVEYRQEGRQKYYRACIDAQLAYATVFVVDEAALQSKGKE